MNGILIINKPLGYTSRDAVNAIGKLLNTKKVGHTGTLDPNASGVLVLCVGNALKMIELMDDYDKEYVAEVILGIETDTLDTDKNATVISEEKVDISKEKIIDAVNSFKGKYLQEVPKYSAVKVNGRKLYEYARNNIPVSLPKKEVDIKDINILDDIIYKDDKVFFKIEVTVSKGTYIRSLIRDIGRKLGVPAVMNTLVRTRIGSFDIENSYSIDDIKNNDYKLIKITEAFPYINIIEVDNEMAKKIRNGMVIDKFFDNDMAFIVDNSKNLLALYKNVDNKSRPYKMFV